uniref:EGF-like domain-containing protein n=1 Tax=Cyprinodon variegatus TaxID=28743 RepID=A0A3Q2D403_CYPVA
VWGCVYLQASSAMARRTVLMALMRQTVVCGLCLISLMGATESPVQVPSGLSHPLRCGLGSQMCEDKSDCVHYRYVCDGEPDCVDGSDEKDCSSECGNGVSCYNCSPLIHSFSCHLCLGGYLILPADQFQCAHGKMCIEKSKVCDGVPQCQDHSDELECAKRMEGCCVETNGVRTCECLDGYTGVSCQDDVKSMQGPIIYGAAGLCGIIVIIAVMAVVLKKNAASRFLNLFYIVFHVI